MFNKRENLEGMLLFNYDLTDIGDFIGKEIGEHPCKEEKDLNIWAYDKESFVAGFYNGYSIHDGTH